MPMCEIHVATRCNGDEHFVLYCFAERKWTNALSMQHIQVGVICIGGEGGRGH